MSTTITATARAALAGAVCDGNRLTIPGQLPAREYAEVKRVLETAGGPWNTRERAHVFPGDAAEALAAILASDGRVTSSREAEQWYPTPPDVVAEMLDLAWLQPGLEVLEPSAGLGAIAGPVVAAGCVVDCVELHEDRAGALRDTGARTVWIADFLNVPPRAEYDRVIMNPPFKGGADARHVLHALQFVKPGGLLVSVMSAGITHRGTGAAAKVRELASKGGRVEPLPRDAFKESGAELATVLVVIPVPDDRPLPDGEPVRVTFDHTASNAPLFVPAAARPGRYVHYDCWTYSDQVFEFKGWCVGCGARTWGHLGRYSDDIRGAFGYQTWCPIDSYDLAHLTGDVPEDVSFPRCAECYNERGAEGDRKAMEGALRQLRAHLAAAAAVQAEADELTEAETTGMLFA